MPGRRRKGRRGERQAPRSGRCLSDRPSGLTQLVFSATVATIPVIPPRNRQPLPDGTALEPEHPSPDERDPEVVDALVERAQRGDGEAFDQLVLRLHRQVRLAIAAHACAADQVEEILQAAWVTAFEQLGRYERRGTFLPWVKAIARNRLREDYRERGRGQRIGSGDLLERLVAEAAGEEIERADVVAHAERRLDRLRACLAALPPRARAVVLARDRDGESLASMARRFKQTKEALATVLWRIRRGLRHCIEKPA